jgi:hypothetical protein
MEAATFGVAVEIIIYRTTYSRRANSSVSHLGWSGEERVGGCKTKMDTYNKDIE